MQCSTLRFGATNSSLAVYSSEFIIVSATGPSIVVESADAPRQVTVTRTIIASPPNPSFAASPLIILPQSPAAPLTLPPITPTTPRAPTGESTFLGIVDGPLRLATATVIESNGAPSETTVGAYPVFLSRFSLPQSTSTATSPFSNGTMPGPTFVASPSSNTAKPSSTGTSQSSHGNSAGACSSNPFFLASLLISVILLCF